MSEIQFSKYEHMQNHHNLKKFKSFLEEMTDVKFIALEKIHGTNYSLQTNGLDVVPCRRTASLGNDTNFMNHIQVFNKIKDDIIKLFNIVSKKYTDTKYIQLYGELFGGYYDGKSPEGTTKIQKMNYCPFNDFMAYDLKITKFDKSFYMDYKDLLEIIDDSFSFKLVPLIAVDSYQNIMKLDPKFETKVPSYYNLNKLENNFAEGYVIKPITEHTFTNGYRIIFKYKNPDFLEVKNKSEHKNKEILDYSYSQCFENMNNYITNTRFDNLLSKLTDDDNKMKIIDMMYDDIVQDYKADYEEYDNDDIKSCKKQLKTVIAKFVKDKFKLI